MTAGNVQTLESEWKYEDVYNFDFRPKAGSSLIDQGKHKPGFTDGYIGSAPDIGAYEYGDKNYWIPGYQTKKAKTVRKTCKTRKSGNKSQKHDGNR